VKDLTPDGGDLVGVEFHEDGAVTNHRTDGDSESAAINGVQAWQRAGTVATHHFLKRKRRLFPCPRI